MGFVLEEFSASDKSHLLAICPEHISAKIKKTGFFEGQRKFKKAIDRDLGVYLVAAPKSPMEPDRFYFLVVRSKLYMFSLSYGFRKKVNIIGSEKISSEQIQELGGLLESAFSVYGVFNGKRAPLKISL